VDKLVRVCLTFLNVAVGIDPCKLPREYRAACDTIDRGEFTMSTTRLTPKQSRLLGLAGDRPVRIEDPEMHQADVLIGAAVYQRDRDVIEPTTFGDCGGEWISASHATT